MINSKTLTKKGNKKIDAMSPKAPDKNKTTMLQRKLIKFWNFLQWSVYHKALGMFYHYKSCVKRFIQFGIAGWRNYDWDSAYLFELMSFKLKRIHRCLKSDVAVQKKEDMAALREATKICDRLARNGYEDKYIDAHYKKWGKIKLRFKPCNDVGEPGEYTELVTTRERKLSEEKKKQERADLLAIDGYATKDRNSDLDRLNEIFKIYSLSWWS